MKTLFLLVLPITVMIVCAITQGLSWNILVFGGVIFLFGWGMWLLGSVYNAISGRRESLFDQE